jgi:hypothetical protein
MPEKRWGNPYLVGKHGDAAAVWPRRPRITVDANDPRRLTGGRSGYSLVTREMVWSLKPGARESCSRTGTFMAVILRLLQRFVTAENLNARITSRSPLGRVMCSTALSSATSVLAMRTVMAPVTVASSPKVLYDGGTFVG